eukprot:TRINITY_DN9145_c0_g1_i1.p1 TRINITY_DN9145_c0_g1~~TRINITY_DN9145_c0_g1_i1.p1  ORF type:complete len:735 (+),score=212.70 TRINITY_DN9145_c0_g1_i1:131-2206(+)
MEEYRIAAERRERLGEIREELRGLGEREREIRERNVVEMVRIEREEQRSAQDRDFIKGRASVREIEKEEEIFKRMSVMGIPKRLLKTPEGRRVTSKMYEQFRKLNEAKQELLKEKEALEELDKTAGPWPSLASRFGVNEALASSFGDVVMVDVPRRNVASYLIRELAKMPKENAEQVKNHILLKLAQLQISVYNSKIEEKGEWAKIKGDLDYLAKIGMEDPDLTLHAWNVYIDVLLVVNHQEATKTVLKSMHKLKNKIVNSLVKRILKFYSVKGDWENATIFVEELGKRNYVPPKEVTPYILLSHVRAFPPPSQEVITSLYEKYKDNLPKSFDIQIPLAMARIRSAGSSHVKSTPPSSGITLGVYTKSPTNNTALPIVEGVERQFLEVKPKLNENRYDVAKRMWDMLLHGYASSYSLENGIRVYLQMRGLSLLNVQTFGNVLRLLKKNNYPQHLLWMVLHDLKTFQVPHNTITFKVLVSIYYNKGMWIEIVELFLKHQDTSKRVPSRCIVLDTPTITRIMKAASVLGKDALVLQLFNMLRSNLDQYHPAAIKASSQILYPQRNIYLEPNCFPNTEHLLFVLKSGLPWKKRAICFEEFRSGLYGGEMDSAVWNAVIEGALKSKNLSLVLLLLKNQLQQVGPSKIHFEPLIQSLSSFLAAHPHLRHLESAKLIKSFILQAKRYSSRKSQNKKT